MQEYLHQYTGESFRIVEDPQPHGDGSVELTLESRVSHDDFLGACRNQPDTTLLTTRNFLLANNLALVQMGGLDVEGRILHARAKLVPLVGSQPTPFAEHIQKNMYVGRPHHFNGMQPLTLDRIHYAIACGMITMEKEHIDTLPKDHPELIVFALKGHAGHLNYSGGTSVMPTERLYYEPGHSEGFRRPDWQRTNLLHGPNDASAFRIDGIKAPFYAIYSSMVLADKKYHGVAYSSNRQCTTWVANGDHGPSLLDTALVQLYDRRPRTLILPDQQLERASHVLTQSYDAALGFLKRLEHFAWQYPEKRPAALVINKHDIHHIMTRLDSPWVCTTDLEGMTSAEKERASRRSVPSSLLETPSTIVQEGYESPIIRLLRRSEELGKDGNGVIATSIFPPHAVLDAMIADETNRHRQFNTLLFRHASLGASNGEHFSLHDFDALRSMCRQNINVYWAHPYVTLPGAKEQGTLLKLVDLPKPIRGEKWSSSLMFIPLDREKDFLEGTHMAIYGTAGALEQKSIEFLEKVFAGLAANPQLKGKIVVHTGGGPDLSTMGVGNRLARQYGMLSIGHPIFVPQEHAGTNAVQEPVGSDMDGLMPLRNEVRQPRQGNMAAAADVVWCTKGGAGTREERGISQADLGLLRERPFPIILQESSSYIVEYLAYLGEVADGTLSTNVIDAISLVDDPQDGVDIVSTYVLEKNVISRLPKSLAAKDQKIVDDFAAKVDLEGSNIPLATIVEHVKKLSVPMREMRKKAWEPKAKIKF